MPNVTTRDSYNRRQKIKQFWMNGVRSIPKLADRVGCEYSTVKRDLILIRKELRNRIKNDKLELIRQEEDAGLLQDIEQINEIIERALANQDKATEVVVKDDKPVEKKQFLSIVDYNSLSGLIGKKLQARKQRAELNGLISEKSGAVINNNIGINNRAGGNGSFTGQDGDFSNRVMGELRKKLEK